MEVHHHPNVEKKRFKEYFLEFLMIFLAVTMGFFAENIRETITEHERANAFASFMIKDLEADTIQLKSYIKYFNYTANNVDTLMQLVVAADPKNIPSGKLYWYGLFGGASRNFVSNDATFQEMKSSGSLRYFDKPIALDISKYDRLCRHLQSIEQMNAGLYTEIRKLRAQFFDFRYLEKANNVYQLTKVTMNQEKVDSFIHSNPPLLSTDKILFNQYVELVRSRFLHSNVYNADSILRQGTVLIKELQMKYGE